MRRSETSPVGTREAPVVAPDVPFLGLDTLWFQVGGTLCNLACTHCFISCSPTNHAHEMMSLGDVAAHLAEAECFGVRDYGITGGEPFLNREIFEIVEAILTRGPLLVLTNGMFITREKAMALARLAGRSEYSLDVRVSLDSATEDANDAVRGGGSFRKAVDGLRNLSEAGIPPGLAVTRLDDRTTNAEVVTTFGAMLRENGIARARIKIFEPFRIGAEETRAGGYSSDQRVTADMMADFDPERLQCSTSRMVTDRGIWVCPILVNEARARMGSTIADTLRPFPLDSGACWTCHRFGVSCRT